MSIRECRSINQSRKRTWGHADVTYLEEHWGKGSLPYIAKCLGRSVNAIKLKANRMGLDSHLHSGKEITFYGLCRALGQHGNYSGYMKSWPYHGCPIRYKKVIKERFAVIDIDDFWKWGKENKHLLDFSKFEENTLGKEPSWVSKKRRADIQFKKYKTTPWTKTDDSYLISLLNAYKYGYRELAIKLLRTEGAIKRRILDLGLKQRPVKADNHNPWIEAEIKTVLDMVEAGYRPQVIAEYIDRSALAIRGLLERTFKTDVYKMCIK